MGDPGALNETVSGVRDGDLAALLARVEAAEGPDREIDLLITCHLKGWRFSRWPKPGEGYSGCFVIEDGVECRLTGKDYPEVTASLDAALALVERVLPGLDWSAYRDGPSFFLATIYMTRGGEPSYAAEAKTPALAILGALLRTLIADAARSTDASDKGPGMPSDNLPTRRNTTQEKER